MTLSLTMIDIIDIKRVSVACLIQACLILWNVSWNHYGYASFICWLQQDKLERNDHDFGDFQPLITLLFHFNVSELN